MGIPSHRGYDIIQRPAFGVCLWVVGIVLHCVMFVVKRGDYAMEYVVRQLQ